MSIITSMTGEEIERLENEIERVATEYNKASEELYDLKAGAEPSSSEVTEAYRKIDNIICGYLGVAEVYREMHIKDKVRDSIEDTSQANSNGDKDGDR